MPGIIISIRFLLEVIAIFGLFGSLFMQESWTVKLSCVFLGIIIILIWSRYGAPKSPRALVGLTKFSFEAVVFGLCALSIFVLYGQNAGWVYTIAAVVDLAGLYGFNLN